MADDCPCQVCRERRRVERYDRESFLVWTGVGGAVLLIFWALVTAINFHQGLHQ